MVPHLPWLLAVVVLGLPISSRGNTDTPDVSALNVMYSSLNSPPQLTGWSSSGGDPCGRSWKGIKCSGSSVTEIRLSGLGLTGSLGYQLSSLTSVTYFDLSQNDLQGDIPYQLPPNALHINLAGNEFTGGVPYSVSQMTDLQYLNLAKNQLNGQLTDMFEKLPKLALLDLSYNHLTGSLPQSLGSLSSLKTLHLQNNQFTGSIDVLASVPLDDLNVQNNQFSGWIPDKLKDIDNLQTDGNSWSLGPAPPHSGSGNGHHSGGSKSSKGENRKKLGLTGAAIAGIVISAFFVAALLLVLILRRKSSSAYIDEDNFGQSRPFNPLFSNEFKGSADFKELKSVESSSSLHMKALHTSPSMGLKPPPSDRHKSFSDNEFAVKFNSKRSTDPISAIAYSLSDLQAATGNFAAIRLLGEGSIGCFYKAKYADGKVLVVKKIDSGNIRSGYCEDFMEVVSGISRLHHPNIIELVGYCSETGYHLLVYEFLRNGSLHEFLHLSDDYSKPLTWDTRIRIALGTARALEYLHEVCSPSAFHKNVKSGNILLDTELNPHLADCGLAIFYQDTSRNLGPGYNAPECTAPSAYTLKSDVYSFGVVMLELLTGRMPFDSSKPRSEQSLVRWATPQLHDIDALANMVDPALRGLYPPKSLSRFADVIALCIQSEPEFRPPMSEVVQALVRCVQRTSINKRGGDLSSSRRSDDSDYAYY